MSTDTENPIQDQLTALKNRADTLGIKYHPSIGLDTLREKVNAALNEPKKEDEVEEVKQETEAQRRARKKKEASALVRIRVTCMNPAKRELDGEIITAGNSLVGSFTKYVPYNADDGWHVPYIIYKQLLNRECQVFVSEKDDRGNRVRKGRLIREFAIEVLPPLSQDELHDLAQRQAMSKSVA